MRLGWKRYAPELAPSADEVQAMVRAGLPGARIAGFASAPGGIANTNIRVDLEGGGRVLLRLYQRDATQAAKEAAVAKRIGAAVPVAQFLHIGAQDGYRFALVEWIEGERLELTLPAMDEAARRAAGHAVGAALGAVHRFEYDRAGFLDAELDVAAPLGGGPDFLLGFMRGSFIEGQAYDLLGHDLARAAMDYAIANKHREWAGPHRLAHCDFNGSNILMRGGAVAAVVDWEFAMSAKPDIDFGNLQRNHPDDAFLDGVVAGYEAQGHTLPSDWRELARLSDLVAWADILTRKGVDESIARSARSAIRQTIEAR
jgi:aminoglycoside phosphotransferase (APT) family kinase protein